MNSSGERRRRESRVLQSQPRVLVFGAGVAGCAAAITLAGRGVDTALVEASAHPRFKIGETLPPAARPLLRDLGVWDSFVTAGHLPTFANVAIWGHPEPKAAEFVFDRHGHGWQLDRAAFERLLIEAACRAGAMLLPETRLVHALRSEAQTWTVTMNSSGSEIERTADFLIDATGRRSALARMLGARRHALDRLICRFARMQTANPASDRDSRTWIEAVASGWWYSALVPGGNRMVAFLTDADLLPPRLDTSANGFVSSLTETTRLHPLIQRHGYEIREGPRTSAAQSARVTPAAGEGWLAVGDAAMAFDPLSSQGMLTALYTGIRGGEALANALDRAPEPLVEYKARLDEIWDSYLKNRDDCYALESRWRDEPFWRRRGNPQNGSNGVIE